MLSERILEMYGLSGTQLLQVEKGYRNESHAAITSEGERVNIIIYKREPDILRTLRRANLVGDHLAGQGFPARHTHDQRIMRLGSDSQTKYAALYGYLPGNTIPWDAYSMQHLKKLGATMSTMHALLAHAPFTLGNQVTDEYTAIVIRMQRYFTDDNIQQAVHRKLGLDVRIPQQFFRLLAGCATLPQQQPLHMDFVRSNILFDAKADITGVLDFEKASQGHPLFDIARTLAFLLVDCRYKTPEQVRKYFLISGYNKRGLGSFKLTAINAQLLEELVGLFLFYDFYKFLRHNPYESLSQNEHFVRTRALLLQRGLLAEIAKNPHTSAEEGE